jgi:DNA helicase II / ATP-dependent DNA helicase PcrA
LLKSRGQDGSSELLKNYNAALVAAGALDFNDLLSTAAELLDKDAVALTSLQRRFVHVLVDEIQDVSQSIDLVHLTSHAHSAQFALISKLIGPTTGFTFVGTNTLNASSPPPPSSSGDDDQCIFSFAGADPAIMASVPSTFRNTVLTPLVVNRRCGKPIVDAAAGLISNNT